MIRRMMLLGVVLFGVWCVMVLSAGSPPADAVDEAPKELVFVPVKIDGPVHDPAKHTFWFGPFAECSSVLDIDGDGKLDIAAGRNYYTAPNWTKHADYRDGAATNGPDVDDNYEGTIDVNNDGRPDVLSSGWMLKQGIYWYENPGKPGVKWQSHTLLQADGLEGMVIGNLAGHDGKDVLVNYFAKKPGRGLIWFEHLDQAPWFKEHALGPEGVGVSHGSGIGDINGDGRDDVVTTSGWFEAPPRPTEQPWIWHPDWQFSAYGSGGRPGGAGLPILVTDVNGDGLNDIIMGSDHGYGLAWFEQKVERQTQLRAALDRNRVPHFSYDGTGRSGWRRQAGTHHREAVVGAQRRRCRRVRPFVRVLLQNRQRPFRTPRPVLQLSRTVLRPGLQRPAAG
jgi:hypothetical protein